MDGHATPQFRSTEDFLLRSRVTLTDQLAFELAGLRGAGSVWVACSAMQIWFSNDVLLRRDHGACRRG
jgi:hypothetical protein